MLEKDRLMSTHHLEEDNKRLHSKIRPNCLEDYIGQMGVRQQMSIFIDAARNRKQPLDHTLIFGPPGLGKTTLARIIAQEMSASFKQSSGPVLVKAGDLAALLTNLEPGDVLFIDEIHRLSPAMEEILYPAMEDYQLNIMIGEGPGARSIKLDLPPFTLVAATTRAGLLTSPLRDRFGIIQHLEFYNTDELSTIVSRSARILKINIDQKGAEEIAKRARGTPRIVNRLLKRVRDYAEMKGDGHISQKLAHLALNMLAIDDHGLDTIDRKLLSHIIYHFNGGPVGIDSLAAAMSEEKRTLEDVIEPFLIQQGFIMRTTRGRVVTKQAYAYFNLLPPKTTSHQTIQTDLDQ